MISASCNISLTAFLLLAICLAQSLSNVLPEKPVETSTFEDNGRSKREVDKTVMENAIEYYTKVVTEFTCSSPQLRLVSVQSVHPSNSVIYTTDHVALHQCAHDGGCCPPSETCAGDESEDVDIPIIFVTREGTTHAEMMKFPNHTTCRCVPEK